VQVSGYNARQVSTANVFHQSAEGFVAQFLLFGSVSCQIVSMIGSTKPFKIWSKPKTRVVSVDAPALLIE
jgi:hypothetical protein